jgi:transcriptional regulator GlxA family with amidase domain
MIRVSCLLYEGFLMLDMAGPLTAFEAAGQCGSEGYSIEMLAGRNGLVVSSSGIAVQARDFRESAGCDILIVPGGDGALQRERYANLLAFIVETASSGRRIASICSGAFLLAEAGLLDGRVAATHWREAGELGRRHAAVTVDAESLFQRDGNIWTSAGVTSGIDLALAIIEEDYGAAVARGVAQMLVVAFRRPGTQSQHSGLLDMVASDNRFAEVLVWARSHLAERLDVERLADQAALSVRHFTRAFTAATGVAPAKAIERLRVDSARAAIEGGARSLEQVARDSGFGTAERMRRVFIKILGDSPQAIRRRRQS